jgi:hypothetical protein
MRKIRSGLAVVMAFAIMSNANGRGAGWTEKAFVATVERCKSEVMEHAIGARDTNLIPDLSAASGQCFLSMVGHRRACTAPE